MFFACHFQEEHSSLDNKNYVESIFIVYRIKYQKIKIDLTSPLSLYEKYIEKSIGLSNILYIKASSNFGCGEKSG